MTGRTPLEQAQFNLDTDAAKKTLLNKKAAGNYLSKVGKYVGKGANLAVGAMGYATMGLFIFEEAVQSSMFGIYVSLSVRDYAHAKVSIELTRDILSKANLYLKTLGLLSAFNVAPFKAFFVAADATLDAYDAKITLMKMQDERKLAKVSAANKEKIKEKPPEKTTIKEHNRRLKAKIDQIIGENPGLVIDKIAYLGFVIADTPKDAMRAAREIYGDFEWYVIQKAKKPKGEGEYSPYRPELSPEIEQKLDVTGLDKYNVFKIIPEQLPGFPEFREAQEQKLIVEGEQLRSTTKIEQTTKEKLEEISKSWPMFNDKPYTIDSFWDDINNQYLEDTMMPIQEEIDKAPIEKESEETISYSDAYTMNLTNFTVDFAPVTISTDRRKISGQYKIIKKDNYRLIACALMLKYKYKSGTVVTEKIQGDHVLSNAAISMGYFNFSHTLPEDVEEILEIGVWINPLEEVSD